MLRDAVELDKLGIKEFRAGLAKDEKKGLFGVRLLPFHAEDPDRLMFPLHIHSNVGPDNLTFLCPVHMGKVFEDLAIPLPKAWRADPRCPECEEYEAELARYKEVRQGLSDDDRKAAYKRVSQHACYSGGFTEKKPNRALVFIADASARDTEGEVQVWLAPYKSVYVEGDERSRTAPGHGYPAHTDVYPTYEYWVVKSEDVLKKALAELEEANKKSYGKPGPYVVLSVRKCSVKTEIHVEVS